jgi:hypothetical protein
MTEPWISSIVLGSSNPEMKKVFLTITLHQSWLRIAVKHKIMKMFFLPACAPMENVG